MKATSRTKKRGASTYEKAGRRYCSMPVMLERELASDLPPFRTRLIRDNERKWVNGTVLHFCFLKSPSTWRGTPAELDVVRQAFDAWKALEIGLEFREVESPDEAEIRIGFLRGDGAWSYVGRDVLDIGQSQRTMNFGWNIRTDADTAIHRDRPYARVSTRTPESIFRDRLGRRGGLFCAREAAEQLGSTDNLLEHHQEDCAR
jgi:hypothetical protein